MEPMTAQTPEVKGRTAVPWVLALSLIGQLGIMIAVPLVVAGTLGRLIDRAWGTTPLYMLLGMLAALATSAFWIVRSVRRIRDRYMDVFTAKRDGDKIL